MVKTRIVSENFINLFEYKMDLYQYVPYTTPILSLILFRKKLLNMKKISLMLIYWFIFFYLLLLDFMHGNVIFFQKPAYYIGMLYDFGFIQTLLILNVDIFDPKIYSKILYYISLIFIIFSIINLFQNGFIINRRFLDTNFTSFLVAQFIIVAISKKKKRLIDIFISTLAIIVILAAAGRASFLAILVVIVLNSVSSIKKFLLFVITLPILYWIGYEIYYIYLVPSSISGAFLRPLGVIFFDKKYIYDLSSMGRINLFHEYFHKIASNAPYSVLFGLGPRFLKKPGVRS